MSDINIKINSKKLKDFIKALNYVPHAEVGVLGDKDARFMAHKGEKSNATIGLAHEYGYGGVEQRSFLREPLINHFGKDLIKSGVFDGDVLKKVIADKSIVLWVTIIARTAEATIGTAFDTQGYGTWKEWKDKSYKNNTGKLLQDTT